MLYEFVLTKGPLCPHMSFISGFRKMSAAFDGMHDFNAWDIYHEFMIAFMKYG